jgi:hypothetical protein
VPPTGTSATNRPDPDLVGFATDFSVARGSTVQFKIRSDATFQVDIFRIGHYDGNGARLVHSIGSIGGPTNQIPCVSNTQTGLIDCGNWSVTASWSIPSTAVSGVYLARLTRLSPADGRANHIIFVVRNDGSTSPLVFQTSDTTWQAYNFWGGNSTYAGCNVTDQPSGRAVKVSYNRPFAMTPWPHAVPCPTGLTVENAWFRDGTESINGTASPGLNAPRWHLGEHGLFGAEYSMIRFLEANGFDVTYISGIDADRNGALLLQHQAFMSVGHDEYWSWQQRRNVERARDAGVHLAFLSGNEVHVKIRWEDNYRTLVTYKGLEPSGEWTGLWEGQATSTGRQYSFPENALTGHLKWILDPEGRGISTPTASQQQHRFWRLIDWTGAPATLGYGVVGYEWDGTPRNSDTPAGLLELSETVWADAPSAYGISVHHTTLYRHPSGALVFGAGTIRWAWGLEPPPPYIASDGAVCPGGPRCVPQATAADQRLRQATVNLLIDMSAVPMTPMSGLLTSSPGTDATGPSITVTTPSTVTFGTVVNLAGLASDNSGVVARVEASTDSGRTWLPALAAAQPSVSWATPWTVDVLGPLTLWVRAIDDSGNISLATHTITASMRLCPCSLWDGPATGYAIAPSSQPPVPPNGPYELGLRFRSMLDGFISGVRFYKEALAGLGTHVGRLWTSSGQLLGTATFVNESSSGWQSTAFASPVAVTAGTTHVVSYSAPNGYINTLGSFGTDLNNAPLVAPATTVAQPTAAYATPQGLFPSQQAFPSSNYWVDVLFSAKASMLAALRPVLRAHWSFDEPSGTSVADDSGNGNHGQSSGVGIIAGGRGQARAFNGTSSAVSVPASGSLFITHGHISVGAVITPSRANNYVLGLAAPNANHGLFSIITSSGRPGYGYYGGGSHNLYLCDSTLSLNTAHHVVFSYALGDGNSMRCYINGAASSGTWVSGTGYSLPATGQSLAFEIGHWAGTPSGNGNDSYWFAGAIDEPFVYSKRLDGSEVAALYGNSRSDHSRLPFYSSTEATTVGRWLLNESIGSMQALDASNNGNVGAYAGTQQAGGLFGTARAFDGVDDRVSVPLSATLIAEAASVSISAWVQPTRSDGFVAGMVTPNGNWGTYSMFLQGGKPNFGFYGQAADATLDHHRFECAATLSQSGFSHVVVSFPDVGTASGRSGLIRCYVNGQAVGGSWVQGHGNARADTTAPKAFDIGHFAGTTAADARYWFQGAIDEVSVFRRPLTSRDVASMYEQVGSGRQSGWYPDSLRGLWAFNETSSSSVADDSENGNVGTVNGAVVANGPLGLARSFDGLDDSVVVGARASLDISWGGITVGAWVAPEGDEGFVLGNALSNANWGLYSVTLSSGQPQYGFYGGGLHQLYRCDAVLERSKPVLVAFSYTMSVGSSMTCYVDGEVRGGKWITGDGNALPENSWTTSFEIGHFPGTPVSTAPYWFKGLIDSPFVIGSALSVPALNGLLNREP